MGAISPLSFIVTKLANNTAWTPPPGFVGGKAYPIRNSA